MSELGNPLDFSGGSTFEEAGTELDNKYVEALNYILDQVEARTEDEPGAFFVSDGRGNVRLFTVLILGKVPLEDNSPH